VELLKVIVLGRFSQWLNILGDISVGRVFIRGGGTRFPGIIKKRSEIKIEKQAFSTESKEQH